MMLQWDPIRTLLWHQFCWNSATGLVDEILIVSPGLDICLYLWCVFICLIGGLKPYVGWWSPMANIYFSVGWSQQPVYWIVADTSHSFSWWKPQGHTLRASFSRFEVCQQGHCLIISYHHFLHRKYIAATWDIPWHDIPWYIYILPHSGQPHSPTGLTILAHFDHWWAGDIELSGSPPSPYSFQICVCPQIKHPKISDRIIFTMCENNHFPKFETKLFIIFRNLMVRIRL